MEGGQWASSLEQGQVPAMHQVPVAEAVWVYHSLATYSIGFSLFAVSCSLLVPSENTHTVVLFNPVVPGLLTPFIVVSE